MLALGPAQAPTRMHGAAMTEPVWFAFSPAYGAARGAQLIRLGAHAFRDGGSRSLCGYVERARVSELAGDQARRCQWCNRVVIGKSKDMSESPNGSRST